MYKIIFNRSFIERRSNPLTCRFSFWRTRRFLVEVSFLESEEFVCCRAEQTRDHTQFNQYFHKFSRPETERISRL